MKNEEDEEEEGSPDFQDMDCLLRDGCSVEQRAEGESLFSYFLFWCFLVLQWAAEERPGLEPWGQNICLLIMR